MRSTGNNADEETNESATQMFINSVDEYSKSVKQDIINYGRENVEFLHRVSSMILLRCPRGLFLEITETVAPMG